MHYLFQKATSLLTGTYLQAFDFHAIVQFQVVYPKLYVFSLFSLFHNHEISTFGILHTITKKMSIKITSKSRAFAKKANEPILHFPATAMVMESCKKS